MLGGCPHVQHIEITFYLALLELVRVDGGGGFPSVSGLNVELRN